NPTDHSAAETRGANVNRDGPVHHRDVNPSDREVPLGRVGPERTEIVPTGEQNAGLTERVDGQVVVQVVSIPTFTRMTRMEDGRDLRVRPRPKVPRLVVECADDRVGPQTPVERNHVPDRAHPSVRATRASEERLPRVEEDLRRPQCRKALPFDGPPVRLPLVAEEALPIVSDLEGDPHAKAYLRYSISSAACRRFASSSSSRRTRATSAQSPGR